MGQASTIGLTSTSISPPPVAYKRMATISPEYALGKMSGNIPKPIIPKEEKI